MQSSCEITRLCETWWKNVSDSQRKEQPRFATQFLELLGWDTITQMDIRSFTSDPASLTYTLSGPASGTIVAHFVMPGALSSPSDMLESRLDFCESTRILVNVTQVMDIRYAFITDLNRSFLYDADAEELLLFAESPEMFNEEIAGELSKAAIQEGSLDDLRRHPKSYQARRLREWCVKWRELMGEKHGIPEDACSLAIDRLLLIRYLFDHDILRRPGWHFQKRFSDLLRLAFSANPDGCGKKLTSLFHDIWFDWKAELFAANPALDDVLLQDDVAGPLLREFALLSRKKFSIDTILESFNYGEAAEKARVRLIPEIDEQRALALAKQTCHTIDDFTLEVDITHEGYRALFFFFDKLINLYERVETEFESSVYTATPIEAEMDLFSWSEMDSKRPKAIANKIHFAAESGLSVLYDTKRQRNTSLLLLYLHIIRSHENARRRFTHFPRVEAVFKKLPPALPSGRRKETSRKSLA